MISLCQWCQNLHRPSSSNSSPTLFFFANDKVPFPPPYINYSVSLKFQKTNVECQKMGFSCFRVVEFNKPLLHRAYFKIRLHYSQATHPLHSLSVIKQNSFLVVIRWFQTLLPQLKQLPLIVWMRRIEDISSARGWCVWQVSAWTYVSVCGCAYACVLQVERKHGNKRLSFF